MILTLSWKELREHQSIWLTMAIMTVLGAWGLPQIVALGDFNLAMQVAALTLLGLTTTYGVICGSMMFAGEHESGTLVFLDIFHGRRGQLWRWKVAIGCVLVVTQAVAVAGALTLLNQEPPRWAMAVAGQDVRRPNATVWLLILPVVALEAYAWGLLGSSLTNRVLAGAAVAAVGVTPVWLLAIVAPPPVFFTLQAVIALIVLGISYWNFVEQSRDTTSLPDEGLPDSKEQFLEQFDEFERKDDMVSARDAPMIVAAEPPTSTVDPTPHAPPASSRRAKPAPSQTEVMWWLTFEQARPVLWTLASVGLCVGLIMPGNSQALWPLATLLLGVVCGTAAFAPEQGDLSYQFLAAQHFPLKAIWRFKILFWLAVAVLGTLVILAGHYASIELRGVAFGADNRPAAFPGTLPERMGVSFFGIWLVYGFCTGQTFVWLYRKNILAVLISFLVAAAAITLWLPSLLSGGLSIWQLWGPPLTMVLATWFLMRAWAGGRIHERKPTAALVGFCAIAVGWMLLHLGYRAIEVPNVGEQVNPYEYRAYLPVGNENAAAKSIGDAIAHFEDGNERWLTFIAETPPLPVGMIETPRADIHAPMLKHLRTCQAMTADLLRRAQLKEAGPALDHVAQILALSRNLRGKAPVESYLAGIEIEKDALQGLDQWLARGKPAPQLLRRVLTDLNRHAADTPPPMDCLRTECYRSGGFLLNPGDVLAPGRRQPRKVPERWLTGAITLSLEMPWEEERNTRIWQLVWAGLFRAIETPHWLLPKSADDLQNESAETQRILRDWLPAAEGPGATVTRARLGHLLDPSWVRDERLFCPVNRLREEAIRARCRVDATRLAIALSLYYLDEGKAANGLKDLTPKYFPADLPIDPYSGQPYRYRVAPGNQPLNANGAVLVQGFVWSTGPDRIDHGGRKDGSHIGDDDNEWSREELDLITPVPRWP